MEAWPSADYGRSRREIEMAEIAAAAEDRFQRADWDRQNGADGKPGVDCYSLSACQTLGKCSEAGQCLALRPLILDEQFVGLTGLLDPDYTGPGIGWSPPVIVERKRLDWRMISIWAAYAIVGWFAIIGFVWLATGGLLQIIGWVS